MTYGYCSGDGSDSEHAAVEEEESLPLVSDAALMKGSNFSS